MQMDSNTIIFHKATKTADFPYLRDTKEAYEKDKDFTLFEIGDTVSFISNTQLGSEHGIKKTGIITATGWSTKSPRSYPIVGVKVENEQFGSTLKYNHEIFPQFLIKE